MLNETAVHSSGRGWSLMHQWGRLFVLMAAVLPTVMNSMDGAPRAASIAHSHTDGGWKLVLVGEAKEVHTCLHLLWTHMDAGISPHVHTESARECASMCVRGAVCVY